MYSEDLIARAQAAYEARNWEDEEEILDLCESLRVALRTTGEALTASGLATTCRDCGAEPERTCCFHSGERVENHCDAALLVMNLILGAELPLARRQQGYCIFLGETGCVLSARPVLCVNYICERAAALISSRDLSELHFREQQQLELFAEIHERISQLLEAG